jgi:hypothetical protein
MVPLVSSSLGAVAYFQTAAPAAAVDPDKGASELNHHIAGMILLAIGFSVIFSERHRKLTWMRWLTPVLFIAAGLFLAVWSDEEIWPRGTLNWLWLLHHDAEARQHKLYALLLVLIGSVEGIQLLPAVRRPWLKAVFPALCIIGGVALMFHQHGGEISTLQLAPAASDSGISAPQLTSAPSAASNTSHHHHASANDSPAVAGPASSHSHHVMTGAAAKIQTQHIWFAIAGFGVALFKFLYDSARRPPARILSYMWANSVIVLGLLLVLYTE